MLSTGSTLRLMRLLCCVTLVLFSHHCTDAKRDLKSACSTCKQITDNFGKGLDKTVKQNFGGGNTAWEERTLSRYETSEIRLMEIMEGLCDSSSFECNHMLEEHEDHFETWWFKRKTKHPDLHKWFCTETIKVCCPKGTFGPDCNGCVGGSERPCHGNGVCDGDGTRGGVGKCSCDRGFRGDACLDCIDGYFNEVRNDTFSLCTECHASCKTCSGATNQDCDECKEGWEDDEQEACIDVNECSREPSPCKEDQYCLNTDGSYSCKACDKVCSGCTGVGADLCQACADGYQDVEGSCTDIDECSQAEPLCTKDHQDCVNTESSYLCVCTAGYDQQEDGECVVQMPQPDVNECAREPSPCNRDQYCLNTDGSYSCKACDKVCDGCTGVGADLCQACAYGYQDVEGSCTDIDECSQAEPLCTKDHQECVNTEGSYLCVCTAGYDQQKVQRDIDECCQDCSDYVTSYVCVCPAGYDQQEDGECVVQTPQQEDKEEEEETTSERPQEHEDL